eukprot:CAMPEP_0206482608 /NCGR_PEP_ID=MMETSP0324_2-20121206/38966_1 /ASSEMBLY_ACC=CAM_ASM_000836 /TAXON_ID=2866 /ORGANISM="Crypthecodinium cohnii, Strain Seligo" /LENGTH=2089 /DNA_ID=CAMNT_0053960569 /DNA_START=18 /DNA_END=6287 /DNA_ORIENTATION=-
MEASNRQTIEEYVNKHGGRRVLKRILIANNGMAATKAIMSMRQWSFLELGSQSELEFIAMASKDDLQANAEFIRLADSYVEVPAGKNTFNYANVDLIVQIAKEQRVDCVWPGWGHASENPALPLALAELGITFLGPTAPVMHALGDKIASTILAQSSKVPCIPWNGDGITAEIQSDGSIPQEPFKAACLQSYEEALACVRRIGYPVVLKASEGGGGKGIRKCTNDEELKTGWEQVCAEVVGSPIFMMQLCTGARHLEVQLMGDEHGQVVALIGRDCSTQRRFQKIFEEGPPTVADKDDFREAEKAAQRLAMSVGYRGAGTVEYLYKPDNKGFYFLELNPRLQVEHPVTEGITGVNVPALQLQVGMGIPLERVPDIRRFYGIDPAGDSKIDFLEDKYVYPQRHVIAARITAENPDDAFRPTSGTIERVRFQSAPNVWGYFSIGASGSIHEYADSQFGHLFATGPTREHARKALQLALKNILIVGEIRNPTEYLVELAETKEFKDNTIDTAWLDNLIAQKSVNVKFNVTDMVFYGACLKSFLHMKAAKAEIVDGIKRGHLPLETTLSSMQSFQVEIAYNSVKYNFQVTCTSPDTVTLTINSCSLEARFREQPDGSVYVRAGERVAQISGVEEPLGTRLRVEGIATVTFPKVRDPSELRSDFNGKLVRYLHADGADIKEGEPFVELEAMKMIMSLRSEVAGKIHHTLAPGAIVGAGDLLANLTLADPSKVQMIKAYSEPFSLSSPGNSISKKSASAVDLLSAAGPSTTDALQAILCGYSAPPQFGATGSAAVSIVQNLFKDIDENDSASMSEALEECCKLLGTFLDNERYFAGLVGGDETQTVKRFQGEPEELLSKIVAHTALPKAIAIVSAILRSLSDGPVLEGEVSSLPKQLVDQLTELSKFPGAGGYASVKLLASQLLTQMRKPLSLRREEVHSMLINTPRKELVKVANAYDTERRMYFGLDLISSMFSDPDGAVRNKAAEVYIMRTYRGYDVSDIDVVDSSDVTTGTPSAALHLMWSFSAPGVTTMPRKGYVIVLPDFNCFESLKKSWTFPSAPEISDLHILVAKVPGERSAMKREEVVTSLADKCQELITVVADKLDAKKADYVDVLLAHHGHNPTHLHFLKSSGWTEEKAYRNMRPTLPHLIELPVVEANYTLKPLQRGRVFALDLGVSKADKKTEIVFARGASHVPLTTDSFEEMAYNDLLTSCDFLERALLHPALDKKHPQCQVFLHVVPPIATTTNRDLNYIRVLFGTALQRFVADHSSRLELLRVSTIEMKVWSSSSPPKPLRLVAFKTGRWEALGFEEKLDSRGIPVEWTNIESGLKADCLEKLKPAVEQQRSTKRQIARAAGSTYIYDFPALMRNSLTKMWMQYTTADKIPESLVEATELALDDSEELVEKEQHGQNKIGMVAWKILMRSPEYPAGREIVLIGNDITIKGGSFGTTEDLLFDKASKLARAKGIPRIYIACNSGARIGGVDELKSLVKVSWVNKDDPMKGFEYIYLSDEDFKKLPEESVASHEISVNGETRHVLDAIIGKNLASTKGGIGVECLQGSGLIAGETSRAYDETFTLSYATGRSVGIGAYLNRLGQRNIQMVKGPMILTGPEPLNKLMGKQIYTSQDQLGGPHIMVPNGVTHELVQNDQDGVEAIVRWLSFVPATVTSVPPIISSIDPISRRVQFKPIKGAYDPRHMLGGVKVDGEWMSGWCDEGSFHEYMAGWGKTVVVGRGRCGGLPVGIIAVETRSCEKHIPADPQEPTSRDVVEMQAGQVWYPDSAYKTAQAIRDFNRGEGLPLVIFANWRGFSGGTRDMFAEVLKYGAMIVDALVDYKHPVTIYIPPNGELRGGAWVVLDPKINEEVIEMFADQEARGGILEPPGAAEIVFKKDKQTIEMMHRCDHVLQELDAKKAAGEDVSVELKQREKLLLPLYQQVAQEYCDLHDRCPRMKSLGAIREGLVWEESRAYLHWRLRRRVQENCVIRKLMRTVPDLTYKQGSTIVADLIEKVVSSVDGAAQDQAVATWLEEHSSTIVADCIERERQRRAEEEIYRLVATLPASRRGELVRDLVGYARVSTSFRTDHDGKAIQGLAYAGA